ncbi:MAG: DUF1553 domain-containing protein [Pirellulales bacterium]|nr:DUF1553 domain-containing protein [Pirellulales bacterium]
MKLQPNHPPPSQGGARRATEPARGRDSFATGEPNSSKESPVAKASRPLSANLESRDSSATGEPTAKVQPPVAKASRPLSARPLPQRLAVRPGRQKPLRQLAFAILSPLILAIPCGSTPATAAAPDFDRDIRPILSDKCFHCHGPDAETRQAELRLDRREVAVESAIVPGKPDESALIARITSADDELRMPPAGAGLSLSEQDKQLLREWIAAGAPYAEHWSFRPLPRQVDLPEASDASWPRQPLDRFVLARLKREGLQPAPRAAPLRLLRRMSLDLAGLPPSVEEIEAFERAAAIDLDAALSAAAERLLASPAFGEHIAAAWLDAARYADSFGYQSDQLNTQWPYRDWVVRDFNDKLPYDQFLAWQLAGDLLPGATRDQILATAFNRMHRMTNEGGSIAAEWLAENAADRVQTFGAAMLGLTVECARCHDHKYDPILARDYYSLAAFFNSIAESGMYDHTAKVPAPSLLLPTAEQEARLAAAQAEVTAAEVALAETRQSGRERYNQWLAERGRDSFATGDTASNTNPPVAKASRPPSPDLLAHFSFDGDPASLNNDAPGASAVGSAAGLTQVPRQRGRDSFATGDTASDTNPPVAKASRPLSADKALRFDGDHGAVFPGLLAIDRCDALTIDLWLRDNAANPLPVVVAHRTFGTDVGPNGFDVMLAGGMLSARCYRVWPGNAIGVEATGPIASRQWQHVAVTYDGSSRAAGLKLYLAGRELPVRVTADHLYKSAALATYGDGHFTLGQRFRDRGFKDGDVDDFRAYARALTPLEIAWLHNDDAAEAAGADVLETYLSAFDEPSRQAAGKLRAARQKLVAAEDEIHEVSVMDELPDPRPTYILGRGAYDAPKSDANRVTRDVFQQMLPPFPPDAPRNRLGLARWLTGSDHPLTARVAVNRFWMNFFGRGLVDTPANFGRQGAAPTHPELLDWLARDFVDHGWDVKRLCRQIVLSAAYQQDSRASSELRDRDPENALLARGPSRRLSAEQIRDLALAASGLLDRQLGGPPVSPYQPGGDLWRETNSMSPAYRQSTGTALHRRSLYSVWKRTAPLPNMMIFDATSREVCTIARGATTTPLQALVLLNDVQFVEAARVLAANVARDEPVLADQISRAFLALAARPPTANELALLSDLYEEQRQSFEDASEQDPAKLLRIGETETPSDAPGAELAALTVVCQTILNLDAAIYER